MTPPAPGSTPEASGTTLTAREIAEQPGAIERTVQELRPAAPAVRELAAGRAHVRFTARGTSDNAAVYGRYLAEILQRRPTSLSAPSVTTQYGVALPLGDTVCVSLSQSGRTEEIVAAQQAARRAGGATIAVTNTAGSPLAESADLALVTRAGQERAVPATKTLTTQLTALAVLVDALGPTTFLRPGELEALPAAVAEVIAHAADPADRAARGIADRGDLVVTISRGFAYAAALETALKIEETCLRPTRGLSFADLQHGPQAVLGPGVTLVVIAPAEGPVAAQLEQAAATARARGAHVVGIGSPTRLAAVCDEVLPAGWTTREPLSPIPLVVGGQLLAEALSRRLGLDPDAPRGLSKVTRTD